MIDVIGLTDPKRDINIPSLSDLDSSQVQVSFERIKFKVAQSRDIVSTILKESEEHDLVVLGSTRDPLIQQITRHSVSNAVAERCQKPMIIVKASGGTRSWIKRWL